MIPVRVYGPQRGHGSWPRVTAGLCAGLRACGALAGYVATDDIGHDLDDALEEGYDAPIGLYVGPPTMASIMVGRGAHRHRFVMIAPNSTWLPRGPLRSLEQDIQGPRAATGFVAPSPWGAKVLGEHVGTKVYTWLHGVDGAFYPMGRPRTDEPFRVLHMASTNGDRKGTAQLIAAWGKCLRRQLVPAGSELHLVCDGPRGFFDEHIARAAPAAPRGRGYVGYALDARLDLDAPTCAAFYAGYDLVCQPSRAEGFGLVPLEARACGVPVVMTDGTGHDAQLWRSPIDLHPSGTVTFRGQAGPPGVIVVPVGAYGTIDDGPGAMAPTFLTDHLAEALALAYAKRSVLRRAAVEHAPWVREEWSWKRGCEMFFERYRRLA